MSWTHQPDLLAFFKESLTVANTESLWGTRLTESSNFCKDLVEMLKNLHYFTYRIPRWLVPKVFARRDRLLNNLHQWQSFNTDANGNVVPWEDTGYDALKRGSKRIRKWQTEFLQIDDAGADGLTSAHLAFSWAANTNFDVAAFWAVLDILRDSDLLEQVRSRLPKAQSLADVSSLVAVPQTRDRICADPILQSIYTETLRIRVCSFIFRQFPHDSVDLHGWRVPQDQLCLVSTHPAHMHGDGWNTDGGKQPHDRFWAQRFPVPQTMTKAGSISLSEPSQGTYTISRRPGLVLPSRA